MKTWTAGDAYLRELEQELRDLPVARRRDLVDEIRDHIESALAEVGRTDDAAIRNVLERLGDPADIAAEARERFGVRPVKPSAHEVLALILLPIGGFIWLVGWVVGAVLLLTSGVWTRREKVIGLLVVPGGLLPAVWSFLVLTPSRTCFDVIESGRVVSESCNGGLMPLWLALAIVAVLVIVPIWTVFFLARRMIRRAAA